jgi:hypothetical protein
MAMSLYPTPVRKTLSISLTVAAALAALAVAACDSQGPASSPVSPSAAVSASATQDKKGTTTPATITFADRSGDAITSNGSAYAAELLSGSTLEFACCTGQVVNYNFAALISGTGPTGTLSDASGFFVNNVGSMAIGTTMLTRAYFKTSIGQINFDASTDGQTNSVFVTRVDAHTWTIDTSAGDVGVLVQTTTIQDPNNPHKTITVTSKTYYHLPFKATGVTQ